MLCGQTLNVQIDDQFNHIHMHTGNAHHSNIPTMTFYGVTNYYFAGDGNGDGDSVWAKGIFVTEKPQVKVLLNLW